jgi:hypothetical protein
MSKDIDITMTVEGLNAPLTARAQKADVIYLQGVDMTVNGIDYTMNSQHVYRHADGTWHHTRDGERFASIYAYRTGDRNRPTTAAFTKLAKMLETIGNAFEARYPERLEEAEYNERLDKILERRERIERLITIADALAVEIKALENGG